MLRLAPVNSGGAECMHRQAGIGGATVTWNAKIQGVTGGIAKELANSEGEMVFCDSSNYN
jgi:hypothetical protein